ncbi:hypothetical protein OPT61_g4029 [Boeremia exigua]|uniref:Uncharacterized protein n=1 Tax=Boeremia exigua TaxID=749465 RepID=A0ACC2IFT1_9PLEO|nr:hypothetical protein OPT61_g4029 [Boeremia exigua]
MAASPRPMTGTTGTTYQYKQLLQEREHFGRVWLATSGREHFVLKDVLELIFEHFNEEIRPNVHIKPDNIMLDYHDDGGELVVGKVQLTDLDNAAYLPNGRYIKGMVAGNENWRSPEAFFRGKLSKPADMFSFGIVCIYAVIGRVIFGPDADLQKREEQGALPDMIRLQRQVSYFGCEEGVEGLKAHLGGDEIGVKVLGMLSEDRFEPYIPYKPFMEWAEVEDEAFRDLVLRLMDLDPAKRITAQQALEHRWFEDV